MKQRIALCCLLFSTLLSARTLTEAELRVEAEALAVSKDVSMALGGERALRSLEKVSFPKGDLWVAHFSPSGHAVLTNSTAYGLLVRFAEYDFVFPSEDSPGYLLLNAAAAAAIEAEASSSTEVRTASVQMSTEEGKTYQNIPAITLTSWDQRGTLEWLPPRKAPGGCTAIAYGQIMRALEWPVWLEEPVSAVLPYTLQYYQGPSILDDTYTIYPYTKIRYDWMTKAPFFRDDKGYETLESTKLVMLVDIFSGMWFSEQGLSGAFIADAADNPWYEDYVYLNSYNGSNFGPFLEQFYQAACEGIPICAEIDTRQGNHAIMISGWQGTPETPRAYFNFGWGAADSEGWYSLRLLSGSGYIMRAYLSRPKKTVQVAPLRKVSTDALELEWALPKCYDDDVNGFTVTMKSATQQTVETYEVEDADARTWSPSTPLTEGETYTFTVTPHFIDSTVTALVSNTVETKILATADMEPRTLTFASREGLLFADMSFKDGAYRSVSFNGTSVIHVTAPASTKKLTIHSMRPDSFPASAIKIYDLGEGKYDLVVDGSSAVLTKDRYENTRVLYTVCAEDEYGTITAKEMILCYNSMMPPETYETTPDPEPDPDPTMYTVRATIVGNGTVTGEGTYAAGTRVTLTATPAAGYAFSQWTMGADTLTTATVSFTLQQDMNLTATFTQVVAPEPEPEPDPGTGDEGEDPEPSTGYTGTFYVTGVIANETKYDANKTGQNDSALCWAYAFSGMIAWYQDMYSTTNAKGSLPTDYPKL
ncbi:MAG: C10 family peptidase [bacterium]|nr:C10 family peptidase [bacterium]